MRYSGRAKNRPTKIRHIDEPKGSATTPLSPSLRNLAGIPRTVSDPNQVANTVATMKGSGRWRPATTKSAEFLTFVAAYRPMPTETIR